MQRRGIEIRSVRPNQGVSFRIDFDSAEQLEIAQRSEDLAGQNRTKIDGLFCLIVESNSQRVVGNDIDGGNSANLMRRHTLLAVPVRRSHAIASDLRHVLAAAVSHHQLELALHDFEHAIHARLPEGSQTP